MTLLETILGSTIGIGAIILALIAWAREHKKDRATVVKTGAESESELASAAEKRANAEVKIADAALEWAEKLNVELDKMRNICDRQKIELDDTWVKLRGAQDRISEQQREIGRITETLAIMEQNLMVEKEQCKKITEELIRRLKEIKENGAIEPKKDTA